MAAKSKFVEAVEKTKRWEMKVQMASVLGSAVADHDGGSLTDVVFRTNTKGEDNKAVAAAHGYVAQVAKIAQGGSESFKEDSDVLNDEKSIQALYLACRDPGENSVGPLFITADWMRDNLDTDQIGGLLNAYMECRARKNGLPFDITDVHIDAIRDACVLAFDTNLPEAILAPYKREYLSHLAILMAKRWHDERQRIVSVLKEALKDDFDTWKAEALDLISDWGIPEKDDESNSSE